MSIGECLPLFRSSFLLPSLRNLSSKIFRKVSNYLTVNTSPYTTVTRLKSLNKLWRLQGVTLKRSDKLILYRYVHCCCCIHLLQNSSRTALDYELSTNFKTLLRQPTCYHFRFDCNGTQTTLNTALSAALRKSLSWWVFGCGLVRMKSHHISSHIRLLRHR